MNWFHGLDFTFHNIRCMFTLDIVSIYQTRSIYVRIGIAIEIILALQIARTIFMCILKLYITSFQWYKQKKNTENWMNWLLENFSIYLHLLQIPTFSHQRLKIVYHWQSKRCTRRKCLVVWIEKVVGRKNAMNYLMMRLVSVCEC